MRLAIVGAGAGVFTMHEPALRVVGVEVVGLSDVVAEPAQGRATAFDCPFFADYHELLASVSPDAVVVIAPHPFHAPLAIDALRAGAHVLVEKPMAVQVAEADAMIAAAAEAGRLLAVNFQHRTRGVIRTARSLIQEGRLGAIQRVEMVATWTRTAAYYRRAGWRGTWRGEGGGVLMNQAPHTLDVLCHLLGLPARVVAWNRTLYHDIETEDTSLSMLEWSNGALGTLLVSTAQAGEPERLEIVGTRGALRLQNGALAVSSAEADLFEFMRDDPDPFAKLPYTPVEVDVESGGGMHADVYANFLTAIQDGVPLVADGTEGRMSLEVANAIILSSHTGQAVELPVDRSAYAALLAEKQGSLAPT